MFKKDKVKIKIIFDIDTGNMKIEFKPKETRPSKVLLILADAQDLIETSLKQVTGEEKKKPGYIQ